MASGTGINIYIPKHFMTSETDHFFCSLRVRGTACTDTYRKHVRFTFMYVTFFLTFINDISVDLSVHRRST